MEKLTQEPGDPVAAPAKASSRTELLDESAQSIAEVLRSAQTLFADWKSLRTRKQMRLAQVASEPQKSRQLPCSRREGKSFLATPAP